jgi:hypothetical protein
LAFEGCPGLTAITIPNSVTSIDVEAISYCTRLTSVYFWGNAPNLGTSAFDGDYNATIYYAPGTTGWYSSFGGRPTVQLNPPTIQTSPQTQTAEAGSAVEFRVRAIGDLVLGYRWFFNGTNNLSRTTSLLQLTNVQPSQTGAYTVVVTNAVGSVTSAPAILNVIAPVERRRVPGLWLTGQSGSALNLESTETVGLSSNWAPLDSVVLGNDSQWYFDLSTPLPPQRFYRFWQTGTPSAVPSLGLHLVPAITVTGPVGSSVRLDYVNQFGPIDAWVTLVTITLTNTSQLYFDVSSPGQPERLYRLFPGP